MAHRKLYQRDYRINFHRAGEDNISCSRYGQMIGIPCFINDKIEVDKSTVFRLESRSKSISFNLNGQPLTISQPLSLHIYVEKT